MVPASRIADESQLLNARQVCTLLACTKISLWRLCQRADFPVALRLDPHNPRSRMRFRACELREWIERQQKRSVAAKDGSPRIGVHGRLETSGAAAE
jgi:predicted DNA-binding transcriptional regulator AlpA